MGRSAPEAVYSGLHQKLHHNPCLATGRGARRTRNILLDEFCTACSARRLQLGQVPCRVRRSPFQSCAGRQGHMVVVTLKLERCGMEVPSVTDKASQPAPPFEAVLVKDTQSHTWPATQLERRPLTWLFVFLFNCQPPGAAPGQRRPQTRPKPCLQKARS